LRQAVNDCGMRERAAELGRRVRSEEGVRYATKVIEARAGESQRGK
jgi:hypothetical protein